VDRFVFPRWINKFLLLALAGGGAAATYAAAVWTYGTLPGTLRAGYQPSQPVPFSHRLHAGELKMDCRYCHYTVDKAAHAAVPATSTCLNCPSGKYSDGTAPYTAIHSDSVKLLPVRESQTSGKPVEWNRIHDLADYVYFNHMAHVNAGVSCVVCHGRIDTMDVVYQEKDLSMAWCITCHRNPEPSLRPLEYITQLDWVPDRDPAEVGAEVAAQLDVHANTNCSTCHR
jgi:hypothetical protein